MELKSLKLDSKQQEEMKNEAMCMPEKEYPYGLRIELNEESIEALEMKELPQVGSKMMIQAMVEVCAVNKYGDDELNISLQITDMGIGEIKKGKSLAEILYSDKE